MSYWSDTKRIGVSWLTGWRVIPLHTRSVVVGLGKAIWNLVGALAALAALLLCLIAPLLFWLAPAIVVIVRRAQKKHDAEVAKVRADLHRLHPGKAWEGME